MPRKASGRPNRSLASLRIWRSRPMILLIVGADSRSPDRPGRAASRARKASTCALSIDASAQAPNAGSRWAAKRASTLPRCDVRHCGAISARHVTENAAKVGTAIAGGGTATCGDVTDADDPRVDAPEAVATPASGPVANRTALALFGNVVAYSNAPCRSPCRSGSSGLARDGGSRRCPSARSARGSARLDRKSRDRAFRFPGERGL